MSASRWDFCRKIMDDPRDVTARLVFADWLGEQDQKHAEQRQREWAKHLANAVLFRKAFRSVVFYAKVKKRETYRCFTVCPDGNISINNLDIDESTVISWARDYMHFKVNESRHTVEDVGNRGSKVLWVHERLLELVTEQYGLLGNIILKKLKAAQ